MVTALESVYFDEAAGEDLIKKLLEEERKQKELEEETGDNDEDRLEINPDDHDKLDFEAEEETVKAE